MLERGQRDGRDRRGPSRGACSITTPSSSPPRPPGPRTSPTTPTRPGSPVRVAGSRGHGHLHAQQPARQIRQHGNDPDRVDCLPHRRRRAGSRRTTDSRSRDSAPPDRPWACHGPLAPGRSAADRASVLDLDQRQIRARTVRIPHEARSRHSPGTTSCLGSRTWTCSASATTCAAVSTVRPRTMQARPVSVRSAEPIPPVGDYLNQPVGQRHRTPADYPLSSSVASATFTGLPSRSTGAAEHNRHELLRAPLAGPHPHPAPTPRTGP